MVSSHSTPLLYQVVEEGERKIKLQFGIGLFKPMQREMYTKYIKPIIPKFIQKAFNKLTPEAKAVALISGLKVSLWRTSTDVCVNTQFLEQLFEKWKREKWTPNDITVSKVYGLKEGTWITEKGWCVYVGICMPDNDMCNLAPTLTMRICPLEPEVITPQRYKQLMQFLNGIKMLEELEEKEEKLNKEIRELEEYKKKLEDENNELYSKLEWYEENYPDECG